MFEFSFSRLDSIRHEGVIQLLRVLIENVAISLNQRNSSNFIDVSQHCSQGLEDRSRLQEFVEVAGDDDICIFIVSQDSPHEILLPLVRDTWDYITTELTATSLTWDVRASSGELTGGLASPCVELLPPLEARCRLMVNNRLP